MALKNPMKRFLPLLFSFVLVLWFEPLLSAQTASLRGVVTDTTGAVVPGAKVMVNGPSGVTRSATSGSDGSYTFVGLPTGNYTVQASAPDLSLPRPVKISLRSNTQSLNLQLKIAATNQQGDRAG
jgi:protocatechuate 3,4-dioxygenase beta subunit